jgi:hypothetical protein
MQVIVLITQARGGGAILRGEVCLLSVLVAFYLAMSLCMDFTDCGLPRSFAGHSRGVGLQLSNHFAMGRPAWEFSWIGGPGEGNAR